jgi:TonB family protein
MADFTNPRQLSTLLEFSGPFTVGEGRYRVEVLAVDDPRRSCRKEWEINVVSHHAAAASPAILRPNAVAPADFVPRGWKIEGCRREYTHDGAAGLQQASQLDPQNASISESIERLSKMHRAKQENVSDDACGTLEEWQSIAESWKPISPPDKLTRVEGSVEPARVVHGPPPFYPASAKMARVQGAVRLAAVIGEDGYVHSLKLINGDPFLVRSAMLAVARWRYEPTLLNGNPVQVSKEIDVI